MMSVVLSNFEDLQPNESLSMGQPVDNTLQMKYKFINSVYFASDYNSLILKYIYVACSIRSVQISALMH